MSEVKFLTKKERQELALQNLQQRRVEELERSKDAAVAYERFVTGKAAAEREKLLEIEKEKEEKERVRREKEENKFSSEHDHEVSMIKEQYLGNSDKKRKEAVKPSERYSKVFKFNWDATEDTSLNDHNPLYTNRTKINALYGRGYIAGVDMREQRKNSNFLSCLNSKRSSEANLSNDDDVEVIGAVRVLQPLDEHSQKTRFDRAEDLATQHWSEKRLTKMSERDWRIFREDFDIHIQGGRAPRPLRVWDEDESSLRIPAVILRAIAEAGYEKPSPIQRQAIPVGLTRKDIIGIAETGSGKTAAFLIPLLSYMVALPSFYSERVADQGPLGIVMAPTRELAQQIDEECKKLARFTRYKTVCVVGGQSIEEQGFKLRQGVEVVIGTPGRILDCLQSSFMVLNQCNYVILDEADRMVDLGFEESVVEILNSMGGLLKSEDEAIALDQEAKAVRGESLIRVTAMFSATMPPEVERIAKTYMRHPVTVKIGDEDSGKNKRIEQIVYVLQETQKRNKLLEDMRALEQTDKVIIFVNLKKQADVVGKILDSAGYASGVLHGGRSQDQREETLDMFRTGAIQILVATDVAGRGLDIPDVSLVINFDMPNKIQPYCHRIGRTGRAGRSGTAKTYLVEATDAEVFYELRCYLESTNSVVPPGLARHPAALAPPGARNEKGQLISAKKESVQYLKD